MSVKPLGESLGNLLEYSSKEIYWENLLEESLREVLGGESQTGLLGGIAQGNLLGESLCESIYIYEYIKPSNEIIFR